MWGCLWVWFFYVEAQQRVLYIYKARVKVRWMYRVRGWVRVICIIHTLG